MAFALTGARIFDGSAMRKGDAVVIEGNKIVDVLPVTQLPSGITRHELGGGILAPGLIDVQVNGGGGALLNQNPSADGVKRIANSHRRFGTTGLLPTVITDAPDVLSKAIEAVREARKDTPAVLGLHVEGPFLDPVRKGAHDPHFIRALTDADIEMLSAHGCGVLMLTVAPNEVSPEMIAKLVSRGIRVSLGHSDARYDEVQAALGAGASAFTHLFNAMSQMTGREPGMVGAALADAKSFIGIIADGHHVHDAALRVAFAAAPVNRFMLITDAMPTAAGGPDSFSLQGREVRRADGRLELSDGTLAGSDLTMDAAIRYCVAELGVPIADALMMGSLNPARFLGLQDRLGRIAPGFLASLVHLGDDLQVRQTWIEGK